jgi:hypothetical protein
MTLLDIFVQFGQFISTGTNSINWIDIIFRFVTLIVAVAIPLFVFYRKDKMDREKEDDKWEENNNNDLLYFECLLEDILVGMRLQIKYYKTYSNLVKENPVKFHRLTVVNIENLNRILNKFDHNRLFHSYIDGNEGDINVLIKQFMIIFKNLEFYNSHLAKRQNDLKQHHSFLSTDLEKFRELVDAKLREKVLLICQKLLNTNPDFVTDVGKVYLSYHNLPLEDKSHLARISVVEAVNDKLIEYTSIAMAEKDEILNICREATSIFNRVIIKSNAIATNFDESHDKLSVTYKTLLKIFEEL